VLEVLCLKATSGFRLLNVSSREQQGLKPFAMGAGSTLRRHSAGFPLAALLWRASWRVGDPVLRDNRCTMHRRDPFDASLRRIMHRTQIQGQTRPGHDRTSPLNPPCHASFFVAQASRQLCCSVLKYTKQPGRPHRSKTAR
jgi:hypothetical protein